MLSLSDGPEPERREIGAVLDYLRRLRDESGGAVVYVHHVGHEGTRQRGSSDLEAWWESKLELTIKDDLATLTAAHREAERSPLVLYRSLFDAETEMVRLVVEDGGASARIRQQVEALEEWQTAEDIGEKLKVRATTVRGVLKQMLQEPEPSVITEKGPEGRHPTAVCYRSARFAGRPGTTSLSMLPQRSSPETPIGGRDDL